MCVFPMLKTYNGSIFFFRIKMSRTQWWAARDPVFYDLYYPFVEQLSSFSYVVLSTGRLIQFSNPTEWLIFRSLTDHPARLIPDRNILSDLGLDITLDSDTVLTQTYCSNTHYWQSIMQWEYDESVVSTTHSSWMVPPTPPQHSIHELSDRPVSRDCSSVEVMLEPATQFDSSDATDSQLGFIEVENSSEKATEEVISISSDTQSSVAKD